MPRDLSRVRELHVRHTPCHIMSERLRKSYLTTIVTMASSSPVTPAKFGERLFKVPIIAFPAATSKSTCSFENVSLLAIS